MSAMVRFPSNSTDPESGTSTPSVAEDEVLADADAQVIPSKSKKRTVVSRLSTVSRMYDIDGDGQLDDAEMAMRKMDESDRGFLTNDKVYKMMKLQMETQQQLFRTRRVMFVLLALVVVLALSNLGTSFAAAYLAKDTTVSTNAELTQKSTGEALSTQTTEDSVVIERVTVDSEGRRRLCDKDDEGVYCDIKSSFLSLNKKACRRLMKECKRGNKVKAVRKWPKTQDETSYSLCPVTGTFSPFDQSSLKNPEGNKFHIEEDEDGSCRISGPALRQDEGDQCTTFTDCAPGLTCEKVETLVANCQRRCELKRWHERMIQPCKDRCDHLTCQRNVVAE